MEHSVMAAAGYVFDPIYLEHDTPGHPEGAGRLRAIIGHLEAEGILARMTAVPAHDATDQDLALVHSRDLVLRVRATQGGGTYFLDVDTYAVARSYEAALRAAGGVLAATDAVLGGNVGSALCLVRPPGHHATPHKAMGFCLFNNVAIAAAHAIQRHGLERVAVIDFDVHHGNGTQDAFYDDPRVLYFSTHQHPLYPGTGSWNETGTAAGKGATVNVPLPPGCGDEEYLRSYREICVPVVERYRPQLIMVSAGFDAHFADPLAQEMVSCRGYYEIGRLLKEMADALCGGKIIYALEGGYDHAAIAWAAHEIACTLLGEGFADDPVGAAPDLGRPDIDRLLSTIRREHNL